MITIAEDITKTDNLRQDKTDNNPNEYLSRTAINSDSIEEKNVKIKANVTKNNSVKKAPKNNKIKTFILGHIVQISMIVLLSIITIWLAGVYTLFTTMPGVLLEKVKEFGRSIWGDFIGFFTGTQVGNVTEEDIKNLAQYIQSMGYEGLESCGFGDVEYEESNDNVTIKTNKKIKKINDTVDDKNYLKAYIAANESTWTLATWSVWGALKQPTQTLAAAIEVNYNKIHSAELSSTGLINILNTTPGTISGDFVRIDRENEKMIVYEKEANVGIYGGITNLLKRTNNGKIKLGETFSYDMSTWTARYGRPIELLLSIHLSTMMPDLAYRIAIDPELNTKVNIVLQNATVKYETSIMKNHSTVTNNDIINAFLNQAVTGQDFAYEYISDDGTTVSGNKNFFNDIMMRINQENDERKKQEYRNQFYQEIFSQTDVEEPAGEKYIKVNLAGALASNDTFIGRMAKEIDNLDLIGRFFKNGSSKYFVYVKTGTEQVQGLDGVTFDDLLELMAVSANGKVSGTNKIKWPYIQSITNHWFYNDIDFTKGVYRRAKVATKKMKYEPDSQNSLLKAHDIEIELDATLTAKEGIVYQVCEPEATGPNRTIIDIFKDKYYKYDGTQQTAKAIDNAKRYDLNGGQTGVEYKGKIVEDPTVWKQEVSFEENKINALTAFSILENMHSEEVDFVYRNLKELMSTLKFLNEEDLTEELKDMLVWLIEVNEPDGREEKFEVTRNPDEYGILIKDVKGRTVIAPENCEITSGTDETGESTVTLTFTGLSDETVKLLKYIYEDDFRIVNKDAIAGIKMKIKGMTLTKTGTASRGETIGTANGDLQVTMLDVDRSRIEDVEEYMNPEHNNAYYKAKENTMNEVYRTGIDIGYYTGDGFIRGGGIGTGKSTYGHEILPDGHGTWTGYNASEFDVICAITRAEGGTNARECLNVITAACNRADKGLYGYHDPLSQMTHNYQFTKYGVRIWRKAWNWNI